MIFYYFHVIGVALKPMYEHNQMDALILITLFLFGHFLAFEFILMADEDWQVFPFLDKALFLNLQGNFSLKLFG